MSARRRAQRTWTAVPARASKPPREDRPPSSKATCACRGLRGSRERTACSFASGAITKTATPVPTARFVAAGRQLFGGSVALDRTDIGTASSTLRPAGSMAAARLKGHGMLALSAEIRELTTPTTLPPARKWASRSLTAMSMPAYTYTALMRAAAIHSGTATKYRINTSANTAPTSRPKLPVGRIARSRMFIPSRCGPS